MDNYATHTYPYVQKWLAQHLRFAMHADERSCLNMVERFFLRSCHR